jgi:hypothetical protein
MSMKNSNSVIWRTKMENSLILLIKVSYPPTDAQVNCLKNNIKIYIKTAPTCFGAVAPSSGSALSVLAKVTVLKIVKIHWHG